MSCSRSSALLAGAARRHGRSQRSCRLFAENFLLITSGGGTAARQAADGYGMLTDEEIMAAIVAGDQGVYASTVRKHARPIAAYAYRMLNREGEAEDIAQETFLRLWTHAARWQPGKATLSTWLHRIAHNLCIDFMRKDKSALASELNDEEPDDKPTVEHSLGVEADQLLLQQALAQLPERQRSALLLTHYQGLSNREVARILDDITVDALESLLARARRSLKTHLQASELSTMKRKGDKYGA